MKRRGFLARMLGAAVAGPAMARHAAAATVADLGLASIGVAAIPPGASYDGPAPYQSWNPARRLAWLGMRSVEQHEFHRRRTEVYALDPDLHSYRSMALHFRIALQRDRNYVRSLDADRNWLTAHIAGWFDD